MTFTPAAVPSGSPWALRWQGRTGIGTPLGEPASRIFSKCLQNFNLAPISIAPLNAII